MRPADLDKLILDVQNGLYPVNGMEVTTNGSNPKPIDPKPNVINLTVSFEDGEKLQLV